MTGLICSKYEKLFDYNKSELILNCKKYQKHIWSKILKLEKRSIFNDNKYVFYNQMSTDGFSCSLLFILKEYKDKEYGDVLPKLIEEDNIIPKIESITKEKCDEYLTNKYKLVGLDPGKIRPLSIIDESNNFYKYSASRRRFETYTKRSNEIINNEKIKKTITDRLLAIWKAIIILLLQLALHQLLHHFILLISLIINLKQVQLVIKAMQEIKASQIKYWKNLNYLREDLQVLELEMIIYFEKASQEIQEDLLNLINFLSFRLEQELTMLMLMIKEL
jgi:hypothetical protein